MAPVIRLGIAGLGVASKLIVPYLAGISDRVKLTAVSDVRQEALNEFVAKHSGVKTYLDVEQMLASSDIDAVWIATPNHMHVTHTIMAANYGKHVICEKPMATSLAECDAMIEAIKRNNVKYVQGHSKIYDAPVKKMKEIINSGELGRVFSINTWNYNDWLTRPLMEQEVDTEQGAGVVFRQGPHQTDIVRYLGGGLVRSVRASAGRWYPEFNKTEGDYTAFLEFENGAYTTMVFNGYGFFDITELTWGIGESGITYDSFGIHPNVRPKGPVTAAEKYAMAEAGDPYGHKRREKLELPLKSQFFGLTVVSCENGAIRQSPDGLYIYTEKGRREVPAGEALGRASELLELHASVAEDRDPFVDAEWGKATLEVCLSILESSKKRSDVVLQHQVACKNIKGW